MTGFGKSITFLYAQPKQIGAPVAHQTKTKRLKTKNPLSKRPSYAKDCKNGIWVGMFACQLDWVSLLPPYMSQILIIHLRQKNAQLSEDEHVLLHDICCCWIWLREKLVQSFPTAIVQKVRVGNKSSCMSLYVKYNCFPIVYVCSLLVLKSVLCGPEDIQSRADFCRGKDFLKLLLILELWGLLTGRQPRHPMFQSQDLQWDS